jgi:hypothetical protein
MRCKNGKNSFLLAPLLSHQVVRVRPVGEDTLFHIVIDRKIIICSMLTVHESLKDIKFKVASFFARFFCLFQTINL